VSLVRTLFRWNRMGNAAAVFWHETAHAARIVALDELGDACRVTVTPAAGGMATLLPPETAYLRHGNRPEVLGAALSRLLGGARPLRVMAVGEVDSPPLLAAAIAALDPDIVAARTAPAEALAEAPARHADAVSWPALECWISHAERHGPVLADWWRAFDERARRRQGVTTRYRVDELLATGLAPAAPAAPPRLARIAPGCPASLLLPGHGGGATLIVLHLLAGQPAPDVAPWLRVDAREVATSVHAGRLEVVAPHLAPLPCHRLDIAPVGASPLVLVAIDIGPA
jgi:hypothetical protein